MIYSVESCEVSKKSRLLDCINKFSKASHELHNSQHNFEKGGKKVEVLKVSDFQATVIKTVLHRYKSRSMRKK